MGYFVDKKLNNKEKRLIFDMGQQVFIRIILFFQTKYEPVNRFWLCYTTMLDAANYQPCKLFSSQSVYGVRAFGTGSIY